MHLSSAVILCACQLALGISMCRIELATNLHQAEDSTYWVTEEYSTPPKIFAAGFSKPRVSKIQAILRIILSEIPTVPTSCFFHLSFACFTKYLYHMTPVLNFIHYQTVALAQLGERQTEVVSHTIWRYSVRSAEAT
jgi:hypothetical protein